MLPSLSRLLYPPLICNRTNSDPTMSSFNSSASLGSVDDDHTFLCPAEIHLIIGPMFAGKTTALLRRIISAENNGRNVVMIKSSKDNRYAIDSVVTHDGVDFPCLALKNLSSFKDKYGAEAYDKLDVIGIDEAQFFEDLYDFCTQVVDYDGKTVIVAGLDGDYLRRRFGPILDLVPVADTVTKLSARCELCDNCALFTFRKTEETETELVGGKDTYTPLCRQHYVIGQAAMEDAMEASVSGVCKSQTLIDETQLKAELLI